MGNTQKWEYKLLSLEGVEDLDAELNALGDQGWEAFAYVGYSSLDSMVLKRAKDWFDPDEPAEDVEIL